MSGCNSWKFNFSIFLSEKTIFDWTNWWPLLTFFHLAEFSNERRNQIRQENMFFYGVGGIGWFKMERGNLKGKTHSLLSTWSGFGSLYPCVTCATTFPSDHPSYGIPPAKKYTMWSWYTRIFPLKMLRFKSERSTSGAWPYHSKHDVY